MNLQRIDDSMITPPKAVRSGRQQWTDSQRHEWIDGYWAVRHDAPALSLGGRGLIQDCNKALLMLFGFRRSDLVWQPVAKLFPQLADVQLIQAGQVNPMLNYLCRCGQLYQSQNRHGGVFSCNLSIVQLEFKGRRSFRMIVRPSVS